MQSVITETEPFITVSLSIGMEDSESEWKEIIDEELNPMGVERTILRLNIIDRETELIDEDWD